MLNFRKSFYTLLAIAVTGISTQAQSLKTPAPSPLQTIKQAFALSDITVEYSRPSAKGRVVFGNVVPFEKIWRTGANGATKITFGEDVMVDGKKVAAGTYALYTIPNKTSWEIMLYNDLKLGGNTADYKKENEVLRFAATPKATAEKVETFTINISDMTATSSNLDLIWENTKVSIKITADYDAALMKNIDAALVADTRPYFQAANYYYENGKDLAKALDWANKAIEQNPKAFWVMQLKAKIEYKMKDYKAATASAEKVIAMATEAKNDDYVKQAQDLIADAKKAK